MKKNLIRDLIDTWFAASFLGINIAKQILDKKIWKFFIEEWSDNVKGKIIGYCDKQMKSGLQSKFDYNIKYII